MGARTAVVICIVIAALSVACDDEPNGLPPSSFIDPDYDCRREETDGCVTVRIAHARGDAHTPPESYVTFAQNGNPVQQYGIAPTVSLSAREYFGRGLKPGSYELLVHRQRREPSDFSDPSCERTFNVRPAHSLRLVVTYKSDRRCTIGYP